MVNDQKIIKELQERVNKLETDLESAKSQSKENFLTKTRTKKALVEELEQIEQKYNRYGNDYGVCFFDIDTSAGVLTACLLLVSSRQPLSQ